MTGTRSTIRHKLMAAIMGTSLAVLLLACLAFFSYELLTFRRNLVSAMQTRAEIVAANSTAALAFQNPTDATEVLSAFKADPRMEAAALYDQAGRLFAQYPAPAPASFFPAQAEPPTHRTENGYFVIFVPVRRDQRQVGTVFLRFNLAALRERDRIYLIEIVSIILGAGLVSFLLSHALQRRIAGPILQLAETARAVSEHKDYALRARKVTDDEIGLLTDSFNDMLAEIQRGERAIRQLNEELEARVQQRTAELEAANRELESFSYSVSHDLRAPLRTIEGFTKAVLEDHGTQLDPNAHRQLTRVQLAAERMRQIIEALLTLSRIGRLALRREPVDLSAVAQQIAAELRAAETQRDVRLTIAPGLVVPGDPQLLALVLENLLANAWKFTGKTPAAQVEFASVRRDGERVFFVRDNGAGFNMAHANLLFTPFQRLHRQTEFEGTGIGLATVQRIIQRHGGRLWAEAAVGQGATFYFTIPERS